MRSESAMFFSLVSSRMDRRGVSGGYTKRSSCISFFIFCFSFFLSICRSGWDITGLLFLFLILMLIVFSFLLIQYNRALLVELRLARGDTSTNRGVLEDWYY
jgi:hypothetical protein